MPATTQSEEIAEGNASFITPDNAIAQQSQTTEAVSNHIFGETLGKRQRNEPSPIQSLAYGGFEFISYQEMKELALCNNCKRYLQSIVMDMEEHRGFKHNSPEQMQKLKDKCSLCRFFFGVAESTGDRLTDTEPFDFLPMKDIDSLVSVSWVTPWMKPWMKPAAISIHTDEANLRFSCLAPFPNGPNPMAFNLIRTWLRSCDQTHSCCKEIFGGRQIDEQFMPLLPTRVLDVGTETSPVVRLIKAHGNRGQYCALSHCWGSKQPLQTTSRNIKRHMKAIYERHLPKTFLDAIYITRAIGVRYLWIDSLCIMQDDKQDWHCEAERMGDIYSCAYLTIAASDAKDSSEGCFIPAPVQVDGVQFGKIRLSYYKNYEDTRVYAGVLASRAWALQERILSRRILHCTTGGLVWECGADVLNERNLSIGIPKRLHGWIKLIELYTAMALTYETDRLTALRGIINALQLTRSDRNYFGIWDSDIPQGLLWTVRLSETEHSMKGLPEAPSWSWVSKPGAKHVWNDDKTSQRKVLIRTHRFQGAENQYLVLQGRHSPCYAARDICDCLCATGSQEYSLRHKVGNSRCLRDCSESASFEAIMGVATFDEKHLRSKARRLTCVYLFSDIRSDGEKIYQRVSAYCKCARDKSCYCSKIWGFETYYWVLILEPSPKGDNHFRRVGLGIVWKIPTGKEETICID